MRCYLIIILSFLCSCADNDSSKPTLGDYYPTYTKDLEDSIRTLDLQYIQWACQCANWATSDDIRLYQDTGKLSEHTFFIEPASDNLILPDTLGYNGNLIQFVGQFYMDKGYPKNYPKTEMIVEKANVFRYTSFKVMRSNYRDFISEEK
jgi:hypothetical protein